jgi:hypothetical protein
MDKMNITKIQNLLIIFVIRVWLKIEKPDK